MISESTFQFIPLWTYALVFISLSLSPNKAKLFFFFLRCRNYVVQYIIELKIPFASAKLFSQFKGNFVQLSKQKFSSHVVEKCLAHFEEHRPRIIRELLSESHFDQLLQDRFANYVIQCALAVTKVIKIGFPLKIAFIHPSY